MIYLDHNATTPLDPHALESMTLCLRENWANPSSPYRFGNEARTAVESARKRLADCVGCSPSEIVFCSSGTESDNLAIRGVAHALKGKGKHIVTTSIEHHAVLNTCKSLESEGYRISYLPVNRDGIVQIRDLQGSLCADTILVTVMHANNETGVVQPVEEIAAITRAHGVIFHTDAVQSIGKLPLQISDLGADLVSFSGHKLYGPKGIAALYLRVGTPLDQITTGGAHEQGRRAGTENVAGIVGFAKAVSITMERAKVEEQRLRALRDQLEREVTLAIGKVTINGERTLRVPNTSSMSFWGVDGESIVLGLDMRGICVSTGSACTTGDPEPSHVLLAMGLSRQEAQGTIRFSLGRHTRQQDIDYTVRVLVDTVERLRRISSA